MAVEVLDVGAGDGLEVASSEDDYAIKTLAPESPHKPLHERIRLGSLDRGADDPHSFGSEDFIEGGYILGVAIADEEAERYGVPPGNEVARLLGYPAGLGIGGHARQMHPAGGDLDEHERIETSKESRVDRDEVAGDDAFSLGPQELLPRNSRSSGRWVDPLCLQDRPHGARRDRDPKVLQLSLNAPVAPSRILLGEP